ncbi:hypothetical protein AAA799P11_00146, partial [Marine Group I thaumarchaeote SCGC AAA799-P11]
MHATKLFRIKKEFSSQQMNLDDTLIPSTLIEMYKKIPDYNTSQYIFMINNGKAVPSETLSFSLQYPKNYLLPKLQEFFDEFSELKNSITKKDNIIRGHEKSIKEQKIYTETALTEKDNIIRG